MQQPHNKILLQYYKITSNSKSIVMSKIDKTVWAVELKRLIIPIPFRYPVIVS